MPDNAKRFFRIAIIGGIHIHGKVIDIFAEKKEVIQTLWIFAVLEIEIISLIEILKVACCPSKRHQAEALLHIPVEAVTLEHERTKTAVFSSDIDLAPFKMSANVLLNAHSHNTRDTT